MELPGCVCISVAVVAVGGSSGPNCTRLLVFVVVVIGRVELAIVGFELEPGTWDTLEKTVKVNGRKYT